MFYLLHRWGVSGTDPRSWGVNSQESHFPVCLTAPCTAAGSWSCRELWPSRQPPSTGHSKPELGAGLSSCSEHICSRGQVFSNLQNCSQHSAAALLSCCCFCALRRDVRELLSGQQTSDAITPCSRWVVSLSPHFLLHFFHSSPT